MRYLVDTDSVADWLNSRPEAVSRLSSLRREGLAISLITYGEIYDGVYYARDPRAAERDFLAFLRRVSVLPLTRRIMKTCVEASGAAFRLVRSDLLDDLGGLLQDRWRDR